MRNILALLFICSTLATAASQRLGHFDLFLLSLTKNTDQSWQPIAPRFLTSFNPKGYNNQPCFFSNTEIYLTVQNPADTSQTDIVALDLLSRTRTQVTATSATAEYSPTPVPGTRRFSVVRVEEDGRQRLWSFPTDRSDNGRPEFPNIYGIGYHCWINDTLAAFFIVGENDNPHVLYTAGIRGQKLRRISSNPGRCLLRMPDGKLAFVQKATEQTWFLKTYDPRDLSFQILIKMPDGSEDFALLPDGTWLAGKGAKLYQFKAGVDYDWKEIADLTKYGVHSITRLAVSNDNKLAVVVE
ncbi:MAG: hypothetical protein H6565_03465 [Lewinellaceae bacterium]|nr:hypothetical protein [Saprospiraceae bacterium]MCB9305634.1 hypothetical protein [Lewinellaceae bacterium]MCB9354121.1 hypothetical protein [Lewinellaceae bacterium]